MKKQPSFIESLDKMDPRKYMWDGSDYVPLQDNKRLSAQVVRIWRVMASGHWYTLREIAEITGDGESSISAQLRHLRKDRFGGHTIEKRIRGERHNGLYEYKLIPNSKQHG